MIVIVRNLIAAAAIAHGVSATVMDDVARCESGYNAFAVSGPNIGLYQLSTSGKAVEFWSRGYDDLFDPAQQSNYFAEKLAERDVSAWTCARMVFSFGAGENK